MPDICHREREIDAQLRALKTSELPTRLTREQLEALLAECVGCKAVPAAVAGASTLQSCSSMQIQADY
jgi:hypothetical protein